MRQAMLFPVVAALFIGGHAMADNVKTTAKNTGDALGVRPAVTTGGGKYGPAGCGLGSLLFKPDSGITQIFAATTNGTFGNQTFGITSGTSNCDTGGGGGASAKVFIEANREALSKDIAKGGGETVKSLSTLAGCQDATAVGATLQKNFSTIFPSATIPTDAVSSQIMSTLRSDKSLACTKTS
jgi:hypothetical protein